MRYGPEAYFEWSTAAPRVESDGPWRRIRDGLAAGPGIIDGWWRDGEPVESGPLTGPPSSAAMAAWLRANGHGDYDADGWLLAGAIVDEVPELLRAQGYRLDAWQEQVLADGVRYAAGRKGR